MIEFYGPYYTNAFGEWITSDTEIFLFAIDEPDCESGVKEIWYNYGEGWIVKIKIKDKTEIDNLLDHEEYTKTCEAH